GYTISETQPSGYVTAVNAVGTVGGSTDGSLATPSTDTITTVKLNQTDSGITYLFGEVKPAQVSGTVYWDKDNSGTLNAGGTGIRALPVALAGTGVFGRGVSLSTTTGRTRNFPFVTLTPLFRSGYTISETQPSGFVTAVNAVGTVGGSADGSLATPSTDTITT